MMQQFIDNPEQLAQRFHEAYERLAPSYGYETRKDSAKPWSEVPEKNRNLMTAVCGEMLALLKDDATDTGGALKESSARELQLRKERDEARLEVARLHGARDAARMNLTERDEARQERDELQALINKQHSRVVRANKRWQEDTQQFLSWPDLGDLADWMVAKRDAAEKENADLKDRLHKLAQLAIETMHEHPAGTEHSKAYSALFAATYNTRNTPSALHKEVLQLKEAIREHRDQLDDDRCFLDDQKLYAAADLDTDEWESKLPPKAEFLANCARYHASRQNPVHKYVTVDERLRGLIDTVLGIVRAQVYYPDTNIGKRQQWVKDEIAKKVEALRAPKPDWRSLHTPECTVKRSPATEHVPAAEYDCSCGRLKP